MKLYVPPDGIVPLPKLLPVTVCGAAVVFFQTTVVPTVTFTVEGLKAKLPLLSTIIDTTTVMGAGVGIGFGVGVGAGLGVGVGVGLGLETVGVGVGFVGVGLS